MARARGPAINVSLGNEFRRVAIALRDVDRDLPKKLRKDLQTAVKPAVQEAKSRVRALPVQGHGHSGFRRRVARGVRIQAAVGKAPALRVVTFMQHPDEVNLPRYLDSASGWRHPVFGNRHNWVRQTTGGSWFRETMVEHRPQIERDLQQVLDDAAETIDAASRG